MTRDKIDMALREGVPFVIKMADGEKYEVTDRNQVALGRTTVVVIDKDDLPHLLPMLTISPQGRATIQVLNINRSEAILVRENLRREQRL